MSDSIKFRRPTLLLAVAASPDAKCKAVKVTMASGGKLPYCFDSVSIIPGSYPDNFAERDKAYEIYSGPCGSFANRAPSPKIEWLSDTALQITRKAAPDAKTVRMKTIDVTKSVHVTFVERD